MILQFASQNFLECAVHSLNAAVTLRSVGICVSLLYAEVVTHFPKQFELFTIIGDEDLGTPKVLNPMPNEGIGGINCGLVLHGNQTNESGEPIDQGKNVYLSVIRSR